MPGLTLLVTSPRVAPGLLSWPAWQAIAAAGARYASDLGSPLAVAVAAAGHEVLGRPDAEPADLLVLAASQDVVWLASDEEAERFPRLLAEAVVGHADRGDAVPDVEVLHGSYDVPGSRLLDLVTVMDRLRQECPWDREQTHRSLVRYLLEEAHETVEAIENDDLSHLREELGDLLLQVFFHARIATEGSPPEGFDIDDVAGDIVDKLVYRHPHVFAGLDVADAGEVDRNWEALKAAEKQRTSPVEGIPAGLPALLYADKVLGRLAKEGLVPPRDPGDLGDELLLLVERARARGVDPEQALREAVRRLVSQGGVHRQ